MNSFGKSNKKINRKGSEDITNITTDKDTHLRRTKSEKVRKKIKHFIPQKICNAKLYFSRRYQISSNSVRIRENGGGDIRNV